MNTYNENKEAQKLFDAGLAAQDYGQLKIAAIAYTKLLELDPQHVEALFNMAIVQHDQGNLEKAIRYYQMAVSLKPDLAIAYKNIGDALFTHKQYDKAIKAYEKTLSIEPQMAEAWFNLGLVKKHTQKFDQAATAWNRALSLKPEYVAASKALAELYLGQHKCQQSLDIYQNLLKKTPESNEIKQRIAALHLLHGELSLSQKICRDILEKQPDKTDVLSIEALIKLKHGEPARSFEILHRALEIEPNAAPLYSNLLYAMLMDPDNTPTRYYEEVKKWWQTLGKPEYEKNLYNHQRLPLINRKLRVGFISSDLRHHSVSYFLLPLLKNLRNYDISTYCYADSSQTDDFSRLIQQKSDFWHTIFGLSNEIAGHLIEKDKIDILIELNGHTAGNRLTLMAQKPAPIQISWLGYPASTGLCNGTFRLSDDFVDPDGCEEFYCEPLLKIKRPFICYAPPPEAFRIKIAEKNSKDQITFGSFNNPAKINHTVIALWVAILQQVPNSKLILKSNVFKDKECQDKLLIKFLKHNLTNDRISLLPFRQTLVKHLKQYNKVDIALDTFPYNGTTTTCEALWMGVPVITLSGKNHVSRVGADLLTVTGCPELIAETKNEYRDKAVNLAKNHSQLNHYNKNLRKYMSNSGLTDGKTFTHNFITILKRCWGEWWAGNCSEQHTDHNP